MTPGDQVQWISRLLMLKSYDIPPITKLIPINAHISCESVWKGIHFCFCTVHFGRQSELPSYQYHKGFYIPKKYWALHLDQHLLLFIHCCSQSLAFENHKMCFPRPPVKNNILLLSPLNKTSRGCLVGHVLGISRSIDDNIFI